jgi:hypothetical protein
VRRRYGFSALSVRTERGCRSATVHTAVVIHSISIKLRTHVRLTSPSVGIVHSGANSAAESASYRIAVCGRQLAHPSIGIVQLRTERTELSRGCGL